LKLLNQHLSTRRIAAKLASSEKNVLYSERKYGLLQALASHGNGRRTRSARRMADETTGRRGHMDDEACGVKNLHELTIGSDRSYSMDKWKPISEYLYI